MLFFSDLSILVSHSLFIYHKSKLQAFKKNQCRKGYLNLNFASFSLKINFYLLHKTLIHTSLKINVIFNKSLIRGLYFYENDEKYQLKCLFDGTKHDKKTPKRKVIMTLSTSQRMS